MTRNLSDIRKDIDGIDEYIVRSFFDRFPSDKNPGETMMRPEEVKQILSTQLRFSRMTWQLINARMKLSQEVGETKKGTGKVVVDEARKKQVIEQAALYAPEKSREAIRKIYELIHDISVRIQNEIISPS